MTSYVFYAILSIVSAAIFFRAAAVLKRPRFAWGMLGALVFGIAAFSIVFVEVLLAETYVEPLAALCRAVHAIEPTSSWPVAVIIGKVFAAIFPTSVGFASAYTCLRTLKRNPDAEFLGILWILGYFYLFALVAMLLADAFYTTPGHLIDALQTKEIRYAIELSMKSCLIAAILSVWVAVPIGYLMSRFDFPGKGIVDAILDIPIVLPPLVVGLSLLILFSTPMGVFWEDNIFPVTYRVPSVVIAQFMVACAFAVRTMRATFEQINERQEHVALTLGCSRAQAFWRVVLPEARNGIITAGTLAWARSLGEFGPILVFSGATRERTEVLPTTVYLELTTGSIEAAVAVSLIMVIIAVIVLFLIRALGTDRRLNRVI